MYNTDTHMQTHKHTHSRNAPILLHNPNLSESTLCFALGFPPSLLAHLFLSAAASPPTPSLLNSTYLLLHSSLSTLIFFFSNLPVTNKPSTNETTSKPQSQCQPLIGKNVQA